MIAPSELDDVTTALELRADRRATDVRALVDDALRSAGPRHVVAVEGLGAPLLTRELVRRGRRVVHVTADADGARRATADLAQLSRGLPLPQLEAIGLPPLALVTAETSVFAEVQPDRRTQLSRAATLFHLASGQPWSYLVATAPALARKVPPPATVRAAGRHLQLATELDPREVGRALEAAGYLRAPVVEDPGSFAVRGGLLDVWPPGRELPVRVELDGDVIAGLREFDPDDQRARDALDGLWLVPAREAFLDEAAAQRARVAVRAICDAIDYPSTRARQLAEDVAEGRNFFGSEAFSPACGPLVSVFEHLGSETCFVVEEAGDAVRALREALAAAREGEEAWRGRPRFALGELYEQEAELEARLTGRVVIAAHRSGIAGTAGTEPLDRLEKLPEDAPALSTTDHATLERAVKAARTERGREAALEPLLRRIHAWREAGLAVAITARTATQAERIAALLAHRGVRAAVAGDPSAARGAELSLVVGPLARGVIAPAEGVAVVTEEEIFGQRAHRAPRRTRSARAVLQDLRALAPGDHVVHVDHGVGRYVGLERRIVGGVSVELIVVEYASGDRLSLPVYRLDQVQKYAGNDASPKLDRLGGSSFAKTKAKVQRRVREMADELLRLYAERGAAEKEPLPAPGDDYATFEATFPFEETRDQAAAIAEVISDLGSRRVMDRLVCGDVGFGKTEVALRAAFLAATAGRQVAVLCPTTVLAQQHFLTFSARLQGWPLKLRSLSRFDSRAEQAETLAGLKDGKVDVVVGTHRLLSKDVHFKRLGLLVVDEEQRFGVTHKERIKQLRRSVDALTLSATPIPRTLQMAVGGLRDMSLITTAPVDRRAIRTVVSRHDDAVVREALERELGRGGQAFFVYNRVEGLYERAARLRELLPNARVGVAHGQLGEAELERTMLDFVSGELDILAATAIIESGLDIPRANTIVIDRADLFGLAQLYQLRGRVGRSSERAYCWLLVPPPGQLTDEARLRIEALERHTELGSGFRIATLDLELRGAGELLGAEQSGFAASVGFDLFCQMLEEATRELRGEPIVHDVDPDLSVDVPALLPEEYVADVGVRLSLYKRFASAADEGEVQDLGAEMEDRFGPAPLEAVKLVELMRLQTELRRLEVLGLDASAKQATFHLRDDTPLDPIEVGKVVARDRERWRLTPDGRLTRRAVEGERWADGIALADRALAELAECVRSPD
ncbi:MAG: transcription-repair coupling factor [Polyangiaceae bacterium]|nr:transcription-repair coupling factor [Polyangiaceae bacterium]